MPVGTPKPATAEQVAKYGHCAATMRAALKAKGWTIGDLNRALGKERGYSPPHVWNNAKGAPGPKLAKVVAKLLDVDPHDLTRRSMTAADLKQPEASHALVRATATAPAQRAPGDVLTFSVDREGNARIKLDAVLPVEQAAPLFRMLLDAGIVMGRAE